MAFEKEVTHGSGAIVKYWKMTQISYNINANYLNCSFDGYLSEEEKDASRSPLLSKSTSVPVDFPYVPTEENAIADAYVKCKSGGKTIPSGSFDAGTGKPIMESVWKDALDV